MKNPAKMSRGKTPHYNTRRVDNFLLVMGMYQSCSKFSPTPGGFTTAHAKIDPPIYLTHFSPIMAKFGPPILRSVFFFFLKFFLNKCFIFCNYMNFVAAFGFVFGIWGGNTQLSVIEPTGPLKWYRDCLRLSIQIWPSCDFWTFPTFPQYDMSFLWPKFHHVGIRWRWVAMHSLRYAVTFVYRGNLSGIGIFSLLHCGVDWSIDWWTFVP